jgi:hypothetical protein
MFQLALVSVCSYREASAVGHSAVHIMVSKGFVVSLAWGIGDEGVNDQWDFGNLWGVSIVQVVAKVVVSLRT